MYSYGSKISCPSCGFEHVVRVGEIKNHRQIVFVCTSCGSPNAIDTATVKVTEKAKLPPALRLQPKLVA